MSRKWITGTVPIRDFKLSGNKIIAHAGSAIGTSYDGINWDIRESTLTNNINEDMLYANGYYFLSTSGYPSTYGGYLAYTTQDLISFTKVKLPFTSYDGGIVNIFDIAYGNGKYIVTGSNGQIAISTNLSNWTLRNLPSFLYEGKERIPGSRISFINGRFVIAGGQSNIIVSSTDGINWTLDYACNIGGFSSLFLYSGALYVSGSVNGVGRIMRSTNGVNWTNLNCPFSTNCNLEYKGKLFASYQGNAYWSNDGSYWHEIPHGVDNDAGQFWYYNGKYMSSEIVYRTWIDVDFIIKVSDDGINWDTWSTIQSTSINHLLLCNDSVYLLGLGIFDAKYSDGVNYVDELLIDKSRIRFENVGQMDIITVTIIPSDAYDLSLSWTSSAPDVCDVVLINGDTVTVKYMSEGKAIITVTANGSWNQEVSAQIGINTVVGGGGAVKIDGIWYSTIPAVKIDGIWYAATSCEKIDGVWHQAL